MRKDVLFLSLLAALAFNSCSNDDFDVVAGGCTPGDGSYELSDVPIRLTTGGATRASIETDANGNFEIPDNRLGVFALAWDKRSDSPTGEMVDYTKDICRLFHSPASVVVDSLSANNDIVFNNDESYYYPLDSSFRYAFYGYHPRVLPSVFDIQERSVKVPISINGRNDIIWGRAQSNEQLAYSTDYFRSLAGARSPQMSFEHKLMRFKFEYRLVSSERLNTADDSAAFISAFRFWSIYNVRMDSVPSRGVLTIADADNHDNDGKFEVDFSNDSILASFNLGEADGTSVDYLNYELGTASLGYSPIGESFLLPAPPVDASNYRYLLTVVMRRAINDQARIYTESFRIEPPAGGFEEGKTYTIRFDISRGKTLTNINLKVIGNW